MTADAIYLATIWIIPVLIAIGAGQLLGADMVLVAAAGPAMNIALLSVSH
jgi:hypothetical protein